MTLGIKRERYKFSVNMMEHYGKTSPGSKIAWPKCLCKPELKIGWRDHIIIKRWL